MKNLITALLFLFFINLSFSQTKKALGFRAGANVSKLTNAEFDFKTNAHFGLFYQMRVNNLYAIQPELGYSNQGGKSQNGQLIYIEYLTLGVSNLFFIDPHSNLYAIVKPGIDFDIDDTFIGLANRSNGKGNGATFIDFTLSLGVGLELKNGLSFEARYKRGFIDVYSNSFHNFESELYHSKNQFNSVFQMGIAYKFNLTKNK